MTAYVTFYKLSYISDRIIAVKRRDMLISIRLEGSLLGTYIWFSFLILTNLQFPSDIQENPGSPAAR